MNAYLLKKLTQLNEKLSGVRKFSAEYDRLQAELKEVAAKRDDAMKSIDVDEACELLELTNQLEGTHFVLDVSAYVVEERTSVDPTCEEVKEPECETVAVPVPAAMPEPVSTTCIDEPCIATQPEGIQL